MIRPSCRQVSLLAAVMSLGIWATACNGRAASPGVASVGSTASTTSTSSNRVVGASGSSSKYRAALAYVDCMRADGVSNFPDPANDGEINVKFAFGGKNGTPASSGIDRMSSTYISADRACRHLLPGGVPTAAQNEQALAKELKFAQCMQAHGVPNFPDPTAAGVVREIGIDQNSPQFQRATKTCDAFVPGVYVK